MRKPKIIKGKISGGFLAGFTAMCLLLSPLAAQTPIDELLEEQIEQQAEAELVELLEQTVQEEVEASVTDAVERQIEEGVVESVEQQVESAIVEGIEQQVESGVVEGIEQQVEASVIENVEQQLEATIIEGIEQAIEALALDAVEAGLAELLEQQIEQLVDDDLAASLMQELEAALGGELEALIESAAAGELPQPLDELVRQALEQALGTAEAEELLQLMAQRLSDAEGSDDSDEEQQDADGQERFVAAVDDEGWTVEGDVWVILVDAQYAESIDQWGFDVRERSELEGLDQVLLRVSAPVDRSLAEAALELAADAPGTVVDLNHVYASNTDSVAALPAPAVGAEPFARAEGRPAHVVGILDTAVAVEHEALRAADIVQRDLVPYAGARPTAHGTAVASILMGNAPVLRGQLADGRLYAASVFFEDEEGHAGAAATSLVQGLAWLASEGVAVVNLSLAGPANRVLEAAVERAAERGMLLVAAVGNNGPTGEPLYPAAYEAVLGITAVDSRNRVYRYASRGSQVAFAAPGVRVRVALPGGGYGTESGTSMAAPHAAAVIARSWGGAPERSARDLLAALQAAALRPARGSDDLLGHGVIVPLE